jgi:hypothetical protein
MAAASAFSEVDEQDDKDEKGRLKVFSRKFGPDFFCSR